MPKLLPNVYRMSREDCRIIFQEIKEFSFFDFSPFFTVLTPYSLRGHGSNRNKLYEKLGWESLSDLKWSRRLFQFFKKFLMGYTPNYLTENLPSKRRLLYGNINPNIYITKFHVTQLRYKNSFFPDSIKAWNTSRYKNSIFPDSIKAWNTSRYKNSIFPDSIKAWNTSRYKNSIFPGSIKAWNTSRYKNSIFPDSIKAWNTSRYENSFFPGSIKAWNNLGASFHSCTSLSNFKNQICTLIRPNITLTFNIHDRQGLKYIFQLRVGLSLLRSHKKDITLMIPPLIGANVILLQKALITFSYTVIYSKFQELNLLTLTFIVSPYNLIDEINNQDLFLYGHRNISSEDNMKIILSTIKYIMETGRFA